MTVQNSLTPANPPIRRNVLEKNRAKVVAMVVDGATTKQIAEAFHCSRMAVRSFRQRYAMVITQAYTEIESKVENILIASKAARLEAQDERWQLLEAVRRSRAGGGTGVETGLVVSKTKYYGHGEDRIEEIEYELDDGLLAAMERVERAAATELGQLPKQGDTYVFQDNRRQNVNMFDHAATLALAKELMRQAQENGDIGKPNAKRINHRDNAPGTG